MTFFSQPNLLAIMRMQRSMAFMHAGGMFFLFRLTIMRLLGIETYIHINSYNLYYVNL